MGCVLPGLFVEEEKAQNATAFNQNGHVSENFNSFIQFKTKICKDKYPLRDIPF